MAIHTKESLSGFVASDPELTFTSKGDARLYLRIGQPQSRLEDDGTFTELDPSFADLVMYRKSAERAHEQFRKGDNFIAEGETRNYTQTVDGEQVTRKQFVASRIGHDNNISNYTVDRGRPERAPAQQEAAGRDQVQQALADREAQLDPEAPTHANTSQVQRQAIAH